MLERSLQIKQQMGDRIETATGLLHVAEYLARRGSSAAAARLIGAFEAMAEEIGGAEPWVARMREDTLGVVREKLADGEVDSEREQGRKLPIDKAVDFALAALEGLR